MWYIKSQLGKIKLQLPFNFTLWLKLASIFMFMYIYVSLLCLENIITTLHTALYLFYIYIWLWTHSFVSFFSLISTLSFSLPGWRHFAAGFLSDPERQWSWIRCRLRPRWPPHSVSYWTPALRPQGKVSSNLSDRKVHTLFLNCTSLQITMLDSCVQYWSNIGKHYYFLMFLKEIWKLVSAVK